MSIDILQIRNANREIVGYIDAAKSIIWHKQYYTVGDFEIYVQATSTNLSLLQKGYYVTRPDDDEIGIIEEINVEFTVNDGYMITAIGRFAKAILDRRIIYTLSGNIVTPTTISGKVEIAVRRLVNNNAISCSFDTRRNISLLGLAALNNLSPIIIDESGQPAEKQVSTENLMSYTDNVLKEYGMSAKMILNDSNKKILYSVFMGSDRSTNNTSGNEPVIFSVEYDNLNSSTYDINDTDDRNAALIGGEGEGIDRFYSLLRGQQSGLQLREMFVNASDINRKYQETYAENDALTVVNTLTYVEYDKNNIVLTAEKEYTPAQYSSLLNQQGQIELNKHTEKETFTGDINPINGQWVYGEDYFLGDIVTIQDNTINKYVDSRITEVTEVQDNNGYQISIVFGE